MTQSVLVTLPLVKVRFFSTNSNTSSDSEHEVEARVPSTRKFIEKKLSEKEIESIETIKITEEQIKKNLEFSVCLEDYKLRENVNKLSCSHLFHNKCVIPWLKLHGTCPVCRESLTEGKRHRFRVRENFRFNCHFIRYLRRHISFRRSYNLSN